MLRWRDRLRDSPDRHFCKCIGCKDNTTANERGSLHVGDCDNTLRLMSMSPTHSTFLVPRSIAARFNHDGILFGKGWEALVARVKPSREAALT